MTLRDMSSERFADTITRSAHPYAAQEESHHEETTGEVRQRGTPIERTVCDSVRRCAPNGVTRRRASSQSPRSCGTFTVAAAIVLLPHSSVTSYVIV